MKGKKFVLPGDVLVVGDYETGLNTYKLGDKVVSSAVGLLKIKGKVVQVVPLKRPYIPRVGDLVIGRIVDCGLSGWSVDINSPYRATLPARGAARYRIDLRSYDLRELLDVGDVVKAKVLAYDRTQGPVLTIRGRNLGKVEKGRLVAIVPSRVPRVIGRKGSMIEVMRETGCEITVGQNGIILVVGRSERDEEIAERAILMVEKEAHLTGLTDKVARLIKELKGSEDS